MFIPWTFACRKGKGPLCAVKHAQSCIRKYLWYVKIDIKKYFHTIDHDILQRLLFRKFKGHAFLRLLQKIIEGYADQPGKGMPIGSLTSQHFANYYLNWFDHFLCEMKQVQAYARYMDDIIWWCQTPVQAKDVLNRAKDYLSHELDLSINDNIQINRCKEGITFCGFRIYPGTIKLTKRKMNNYKNRRKYWERLYLNGRIDGEKLQSAYSSVHQITAHADSLEWLRKQNNKFDYIEA
jgi:hypothetical protein